MLPSGFGACFLFLQVKLCYNLERKPAVGDKGVCHEQQKEKQKDGTLLSTSLSTDINGDELLDELLDELFSNDIFSTSLINGIH